MTARLRLIVFMAALVVLDLGTKAWALNLPPQGVPVLPFFDLSLGFNTGVSFGMFATEGVYGYVVLSLFTFAVSMMFLVIAWRAKAPGERVGYGAIVGGALGNLIDRLPDGAVTDFLDFHVKGWHFPTFNLADVAITIGVMLLIGAALSHPDKEPAHL